MIARSWAGERTTTIAAALGCHPQTVRERLIRFNAEGLHGLGDRPGPGRKPRLSEEERSRIITLAQSTPPGMLTTQADGRLVAAQPEGAAGEPWMCSRRHRRRVSRWDGARYVASCGERRCAGGAPAPGPAAPTRPSSQKGPDCCTLHQPAGRCDGLLRRRTGPADPRTYPPAPGWSPDGHRVKAPLEYGRGPETVWVYGALRVRDGQALTLSAPSRNTTGYLGQLAAIDQANPAGDLFLIMDNLSSHTSAAVREWLAAHPRITQVPIPTGTCWLNVQEGWWRLFRRAACAG